MTVSSNQAGAGLEILLPRAVEAPGIARAAVADLCAEHGVERRLTQTIVLLVSEVVSNAVLHSAGPTDADIVLDALVRDDAVRVTVTDAGDGFTPGPRDPRRLDGGYGLFLVAKAASRWEVRSGAPTRVWFELDRGA
jgi:anti-sigma regulatory factor (Ser/Thr protein kinase)